MALGNRSFEVAAGFVLVAAVAEAAGRLQVGLKLDEAFDQFIAGHGEQFELAQAGCIGDPPAAARLETQRHGGFTEKNQEESIHRLT